ncbi:hypothetical protein [Natrinema halophilum]|uniref:Uncharacterized protein n=1 Tax=Natrinema halophilum TaxID=1699371 RepID=A0A7D5GIU3_9EURY|nr:hypothetical protein [Natrinema halophilum]QLG50148.1 hypothetical protein HYG82_15440 [Natrinema halophilum]
MSHSTFRPTHTVVFGAIDRGSERAATADAITGAAAHAGRVCLRIDCDCFVEEYPDRIDRLRTTCDRVTSADANYDDYCTREVNETPVVHDILTVESWHLYACVQHVRLDRDGETVLLYNADHRQFDIDGDAVPGALTEIETAFDGVAAGVLPKRPLCEWVVDGTRYVLSPPSLCVGSACFGLENLRNVTIDPGTMTISLEWASSRPSNAILAAITGLVERIGPDRPTKIEFNSRETFEAAEDGFETILAAIG